MTQYLQIDPATREVVGAHGRPDAPDFVGQLDEPPAVDNLQLWQGERLSTMVRPTPGHRLFWPVDAVAPEWQQRATLAEAQVHAWQAVKAARDAAEAAPFLFDGSSVDPNKENIAGAALAALLAQLSGVEVSRNWTLANNSIRALTGAQLIQMGLALTDRVDAIHEHGRELRELIDNAGSPDQAYGYTWNLDDGE